LTIRLINVLIHAKLDIMLHINKEFVFNVDINVPNVNQMVHAMLA